AEGGVEGHRGREAEPLSGRRGEPHPVALARQERVEDLAHDLLVVDDENGRVHIAARPASASGRRIENRVPWPTWLSQLIVPPCSCTIPYVIDRPSPVPLPIAFVVKNGS